MKRATPALFPVSTSRTLFCLPRCFSLPVHRESSSSAGCVWLRSLSPRRSSRLPSYGRPCFPCEIAHTQLHREPEVLKMLDVRRSGFGVSDRKSTRLNSSHVAISYAVFCLKKKKKYQYIDHV